MANSVTVDILFKYKEAGENALKTLDQSLRSFTPEKLVKPIQNSIQEASKNVNSSIQSSIDELRTLQSESRKTSEAVEESSEKITNSGVEAQEVIEETTDELKVQDSLLKSILARSVLYTGGLYVAIGAVMAGLENGTDQLINISFSSLLKYAEDIIPNAFAGLKNIGQDTFFTWRASLEYFLEAFKPSVWSRTWERFGFMSQWMDQVLPKAVKATEIFGTIGNISRELIVMLPSAAPFVSNIVGRLMFFPIHLQVSKLLLADAFEFVKRIFGYSSQATTVAERASRSMVTIDSALHSTTQYFSMITKSLVYLGGWWSGIFSSILVVPAILKNVMEIFGRGISYFVSNVAGAMGGVRAQLNIGLLSVRGLLYEFGKAGSVIDSITKKTKTSWYDLPGQFSRVSEWMSSKLGNYLGRGQSLVDKFAGFIKSGGLEAFLKKLIDLVDNLLKITTAFVKGLDSASVPAKKLQDSVSKAVPTSLTKEVIGNISSTYKSVLESMISTSGKAETVFANIILGTLQVLKLSTPIALKETKNVIRDIVQSFSDGTNIAADGLYNFLTTTVPSIFKKSKQGLSKDTSTSKNMMNLVPTKEEVEQSLNKVEYLYLEKIKQILKKVRTAVGFEETYLNPFDSMTKEMAKSEPALKAILDKIGVDIKTQAKATSLIPLLDTLRRVSQEGGMATLSIKEGFKATDAQMQLFIDKFTSKYPNLLISKSKGGVYTVERKLMEATTKTISDISKEIPKELSSSTPVIVSGTEKTLSEVLKILEGITKKTQFSAYFRAFWSGLATVGSPTEKGNISQKLDTFIKEAISGMTVLDHPPKEKFASMMQQISVILADDIKTRNIQPLSAAFGKFIYAFLNKAKADNASTIMKEKAKLIMDLFYEAMSGVKIGKVLKLEDYLGGKIPGSSAEDQGKIKESGKAFISTFVSGILLSLPFLTKAMETVTAAADQFLPHSDAKVGALSGLSKSGRSLVSTFASGITSGVSVVVKAVDDMTKRIDMYLPHSDSILGALTSLTKSGIAIPVTLAQGVKQGQDSLISAVDILADTVLAALKPAVDMLLLSERLNISSKSLSGLEYALAGLGVKANDLVYPMQNLNKLLTDKLSVDQMGIIALLGLNLDKARESADPLNELFLQFVDSLKNVSLYSELGTKALSTMGIMTNSSLTNVFKMSRKEIEAVANESYALGAFWMDGFSRTSLEITKIWEKLRLLKNFVFQDLLEPILPVLKEISDFIYDFVLLRRNDIRIIASMAGEMLASFYRMIPIFFKFLTEDTDRAIKTVLTLGYTAVNTFLGLMKSLLFGFIISDTVGIILAGITFIWNLVKAKFSSIAGSMTAPIKTFFLDLANDLLGILKSVLQDMPTKLQKWLGLDEIILKIEETRIKNVNAIRDLGKASTDNLKKDIDEAGKVFIAEYDALSNGGKKFVDKEAINKTYQEMKAQVKEFASTMKDAVAGTPLQEEVNKLFTTIEAKYNQLGKVFEAPKRAIENIKEGVKEVTESFNSMAGVTSKLLLERAIIFEELAVKAGLSTDAIVEGLKKEREELETLNRLRALGATEQEIDAAKKLQAQGRNKKEGDDENKIWRTRTQVFGNFSKAFSDMYELSGKKHKEFLIMSRAMAIVEATINTAVAVTEALKMGGYIGPILAASIGVMGATQVAMITAQTIGGYATGGRVEGQSGIDTIPARLTRNEFVQPVSAVEYYGLELMEMIRRKMIPREWLMNMTSSFPSFAPPRPAFAFNSGGLVSGKENGKEMNMTIINTVEKADILDIMASQPGQQIIMNAIKLHASTVAKVIRSKG